MGTELLRRGVPTPLPLWSAPANVTNPEVVRTIHTDYVAAGAQLVTTNTFRTTHYAMKDTPHRAEWERWNRQAVNLARQAAGESAWVLGSVTTLEDCYRPDLVPAPQVLESHHRRQVDLLASLEIDGLLLETFNTLRELDTAYTAARAHPLPVLVAVVLRDGETLYDGTPLRELVAWVEDSKPDVLLVNCAAPPIVDAGLRYLKRYLDIPLGAYANVGRPGGEMGFEFTHAYTPADYVLWARRWVDLGVRALGGCCGTTPDYIRALRFE